MSYRALPLHARDIKPKSVICLNGEGKSLVNFEVLDVQSFNGKRHGIVEKLLPNSTKRSGEKFRFILDLDTVVTAANISQRQF